jgi:hypothetical protein
MASSGKKKTTMAKLARESKLRERRLDKQAKKDARKHAQAHQPDDALNVAGAEPAGPAAWPALGTVDEGVRPALGTVDEGVRPTLGTVDESVRSAT